MNVRTLIVSGPELRPYLSALAALRIRVFRDYPYLYEGSTDYETNYLNTYFAAGSAMAVLALDADKEASSSVVGASTGVLMAQEDDAFKRPFIEKGIDPETMFYCGESVLLPQYRGQGLYRTFFREREQFARQLGGVTGICFCAVVRPEHHPARPPGYQPLDSVWKHFGYQPRTDLMTEFSWREVGAVEETRQTMMFWLKQLC